MGWTIMPLRRFADFSGRSRRLEYWMFYLFLVVVSVAIVVGAMAIADATGNLEPSADGKASANGVYAIYALLLFWAAMLIPYLAVLVRRLHDSDKSGWWILIYFAPLGGLVLFVFTLLNGTAGPNRFGEDPINGPSHAEIFA
jgi:uncharacterized membrane protein YhaH (DUF805 family)